MFVFMAAIVLGPKWVLASISLYLAMGAFGIPVFAGGTGGIGRLFGPTGGYLLGYIPASYITALIVKKTDDKVYIFILAMFIGSIILYLTGVTWLKFVTGMEWTQTLKVGMYPFIIGDIIKIIAASFIVKSIPFIKSDSHAKNLSL